MAEDNYTKNARQDALRKKENEDYQKHLAQEKEENEAPRKAVGEAVDKAMDFVKGKAKDFADSDFAKGMRNYGRLYKEGLGMRDKNDNYEKKSGGKISLKDCKVNTAEKRNPKHKNF